MTGCDYWDVEEVSLELNSADVRDGAVFETAASSQRKFRIRAFHKGAWAFASVSKEDKVAGELEHAKRMAVKLSKKLKGYGLGPADVGGKFAQRTKINPADVSLEAKIDCCLELEKAARISSNLNTVLQFSDSALASLLRTSEGGEVEQKLVRCGISLMAIAREGGLLQRMYVTERKSAGWEVVDALGESFAKDCSRRALALLKAKPAPSGKMTTVLDPILFGTFIHEALGHATEGDIVANRQSLLRGKIGKRIAPRGINIFDDKTIAGGFGSYGFDRDGTKCGKTALVADGVLKNFLNSRDSAGKLGSASSGNCRGTFNHVRMSNTVMESGKTAKSEIVRETKSGIYLLGSSGGEVDTTNGSFNFAALEGYLIEKGKLTQHVRDVALLGKTLDVLKNIDMVGKDFRMEGGFCGKSGEWVPVGTGGPTIRTKAVVGGRT